MRYNRPSRLVHKQRKRWEALRAQALRRDGYQCRRCGSRLSLEVDHVKPVRDHPALAFDFDNLAVLCSRCHGQKTAAEVLGVRVDPEREKWQRFIEDGNNAEIKKD